MFASIGVRVYFAYLRRGRNTRPEYQAVRLNADFNRWGQIEAQLTRTNRGNFVMRRRERSFKKFDLPALRSVA